MSDPTGPDRPVDSPSRAAPPLADSPLLAEPPRLARWLLGRLLPQDSRGASILGDLLEEFHAETTAANSVEPAAELAHASARRARSAAARRFWRHALSIAARQMLARVTRPPIEVAARDDLPTPRRAPMGFGLLHEDVRYGVRALLRTPTFTLIALATLALGIGASTAIFSLAYTVLMRPLPYAEPERLVHLNETYGSNHFRGGVSWLNFIDWRARATSFEDLAATLSDAVNVTGDHPQRLNSRTSTWNFFRVLGVRPALGRLFTESDARPGAPAVIVITYELWRRDYGADPAVIGQTMAIEHLPHTIVGVLPQGFQFRAAADVYRLLEPLAAADFRGMTYRANHTNLFAEGRLKPSVTLEQARTEMDTIAANLAREYLATNSGNGAAVDWLAETVVSSYRPTFIVLTGGVSLLLLIACVNLANLLLTRGSARAHELAIRAAIGGSRWRLVRQLLVEQIVLIAVGVLLGAITGRGLLALLIALAPADVPRLNEVHLNDALLFYTAAIAGLSALAFGFIPAFKASSVRGQELLVRAGRTAQLSTTRLRRSLMIAEVAVATVLLAGSGLMVQTMLRLTQTDPGFDARNLLTLNVDLMGDAWPNEKRAAVFAPIVERLRALPGVDNAAVTLSLPIDGSRWNSIFVVGDKAPPPRAQMPSSCFTPVSSGYFETMKIPLRRGRLFDSSDRAGSQTTAVINETFARRNWPGEDPIGKRIKQGWPEDDHPWRTVVGVVGDVKTGGLDQDVMQQVYLPVAHEPLRNMIVVLRGEHVDRMLPSVSAALREFDKEMPIYGVQTMDTLMSLSVARRRVSMVVLSVFGAVSLLLAMIGLYGVITYGVSERTQEIGLRMALGATGGQVQGLFLRQGLFAAACGVIVGIAIALGLTRWLETLLFGVTATDVPTFVIVMGLLLLVAATACYIPARRAARVDPLIALRSDRLSWGRRG